MEREVLMGFDNAQALSREESGMVGGLYTKNLTACIAIGLSIYHEAGSQTPDTVVLLHSNSEHGSLEKFDSTLERLRIKRDACKIEVHVFHSLLTYPDGNNSINVQYNQRDVQKGIESYFSQYAQISFKPHYARGHYFGLQLDGRISVTDSSITDSAQNERAHILMLRDIFSKMLTEYLSKISGIEKNCLTISPADRMKAMQILASKDSTDLEANLFKQLAKVDAKLAASLFPKAGCSVNAALSEVDEMLKAINEGADRNPTTPYVQAFKAARVQYLEIREQASDQRSSVVDAPDTSSAAPPSPR